MSNLVKKTIQGTVTDCSSVGGPRVIHVTSSDPNCAVAIRPCTPDGSIVGPRIGQGKILDSKSIPALDGLSFLLYEVVAGGDKTPTVVMEGPPNPAASGEVVGLHASPSFTDCGALAPERTFFVVSTDPNCVVGIRASPDGTAVGPRVLTFNEFERDNRPFRWLAFEVLGGNDKTPTVIVLAKPSNLARDTRDGISFPTGLAAGSVNGYRAQLYVNDTGAPVAVTGIALDVPVTVAQDPSNADQISVYQYSSASPRVQSVSLAALTNATGPFTALEDNFIAAPAGSVLQPGEALYVVMTSSGNGTALPAGTRIRPLF